MSSSQEPNSPRHDGHTTLVALGVALLGLVAIELGFRAFAVNLSGNLAHIRDFDRLLGNFSTAEGKRVVFIGNSLTNNAISPDRFVSVASTLSGEPYTTLKFVPDGTTLWDWRCIVDRLPPARQGDHLILGYAWDQLTDQQTLRVDRTFGLLCPIGELPQTSAYAGLSAGDWLEAGLSRISLLYVLRERIGSEVLARLVPNFESQMQRINDASRDGAGTATDRSTSRTYMALTEMLQRARALGYDTTIVAMPTVSGYQTDPNLQAVLENSGVEYLDLRNLPQLDASYFVDSIHLGPAGAEIFTEVLTRREFEGTPPQSGM